MSRELRRGVPPPKDEYATAISHDVFRTHAASRRHRSRPRTRTVLRAAATAPPAARPAHISEPLHPPAHAQPQPAPVDDYYNNTGDDEWSGLGDLMVQTAHPRPARETDFIFDDPMFDYARFPSDPPGLHPISVHDDIFHRADPTQPIPDLFVSVVPPAQQMAQQPAEPAAPAADEARLAAFAAKARPQTFWSESEFLFMHGHLEQAAEAAKMPGEVPAKAAGQHRPLGTVMFLNRLPKALRDCPCRCDTRNPCGDVSIADMLRQFVRIGYLRDGELLQLMLPAADTYADRWRALPVFVGRFRILNEVYAFVDEGSGDVHCCPTAWAFTSFMVLCAQDVIPDTEAAARQVSAQLMLRSHALRFVRAQLLDVSLWQMATSYRHDLGMWIRSQPPEATRGRVPLKDPPSAATFKSRDELRRFFAEVATVSFNETNMWMSAQTRRIRELMLIIDGYRARLASVTDGQHKDAR